MCIVRQCSVMSDAHQCYFSYDFLVIVTVIVTHFLSFSYSFSFVKLSRCRDSVLSD